MPENSKTTLSALTVAVAPGPAVPSNVVEEAPPLWVSVTVHEALTAVALIAKVSEPPLASNVAVDDAGVAPVHSTLI